MLISIETDLKNIKFLNHLYLYDEFFETKNTEFDMFFKTILVPESKTYFKKFYRYKIWLEDSDYSDFIKLMLKEGKFIKYNNYLSKILKQIYFFQLLKYVKGYEYIQYLKDPVLITWLYNFKYLFKITLYFKFNFHKVDKNKKKHSRKKKLKYQVVYNYIPMYKRRKYFLKLILTQVKYMMDKKFIDKLYNLICWLIKKPKTTYIFKMKRFIYWTILKNKYQTNLINSK